MLLPLFFCSDGDEDKHDTHGSGGGVQIVCLPPELEVVNISEFTIKQLYMHDNHDYSGAEAIAVDMHQYARRSLRHEASLSEP